MKTSSILMASLLFGFVNLLQAQPAAKAKPADTDYAVTERGANHRVWQRTTYEQGPDGKVVPHVHSYTELASGMHYKDTNGQWAESKELIESYQGGAIARQGQHQVIFANNLNSAGAIDMQTPDGKRLRSNILGLMYFDTATGDAVMIAELKDSEGRLISANQVLYPDAFEGVKADVQYTYRRDGFEQDVILREQPPTPESFGMNPATTELEVFTEFINPPEASVKDNAADNGLEADQEIGWGTVTLGRGKAFNLGDQTTQAPVAKRYVKIQGRFFLLEKVSMKDILPAVSKLPEQAANPVKLPVMAFKSLTLPKTPLARSGAGPMRMASLAQPDKGYVLDYVTRNASYTNYTFQGDTTYYITGPVNTYETTTIEGGAVLKYTNGTTASLTLNGPLNCQTGPYRPAVFTAKDDNTVGETISGSSGNPSGYYGDTVINYVGAVPLSAHDLRVSYAFTGIYCGTSGEVKDCQFGNVYGALVNVYQTVAVRNVLVYKAQYVFGGYEPGFQGENLTIHNASSLYSVAGYTSLTLTNSLLICVTNWGSSFVSVNNVTNSSGSGVFQTVGAGSYYLATNSPYRNAGTTNIDSSLLADLRQKTTYPPIVYSNTTISVITTLSPQAQRDTDTPDLGYHYDPLDYVFGASISKSNLTFTAGTAAGYFYNSSGGTYGLALGDSATASFCGTATSPCRWVKYNAIQEGGNGLWNSQSWLGGITGQSYTYAAPAIQAQFTKCSVPAGEGNVFRDNWSLLVIRANNCEFYSGSAGGYYSSENFTNCLFVNTAPGLWWNYGAANLTLQNCTLIRGNFTADHDHSGDWPVTIVNCAFDGTIFYMNPHSNSTNGYYSDYNTFLSGSNRTYFAGSHDLTITNSYNWQSSWLGDFYLPYDSALIDAGSTNADLLGLYHFTTQTSQGKEYTSIVDIGYHYVAVDATYGNWLDYDNDGVPDYLEDLNGNGVVDTGETDWQSASDTGLKVWITRPRNGSTLP